jgi:predicted regulator of Ras-like GTPase activity (Roadblock/LC7/MglB family)
MHNYQKPEPLQPIFSSRQFQEINIELLNLAQKLKISAVLLVTSSGQILAKQMRKSWKENPILLTTLSASSYSAANEMARILGESSRFRMVLYEGTKHNIYVCSVSQHYFLIVVFETGVALGMVRLFTRKTIEGLTPLLNQKPGSGRIHQIFDQDFQSQLGEELDRSLTENPPPPKKRNDDVYSLDP